ncbi:MAG: NUDIX hydrolase, partial [Caulobacteraceae bacterium]|nr:NUDIX hydrolase [Caulobacter sp.]
TPAAAGPWAGFAADGRLPDLAALSFVARAVTPPQLPRRFDARFFQADAEALAGLDARPSPELEEVGWLTLAQAREVELPSVTRFLLKELGLRLAGEARAPLFLRVSHGRRRADPLGELPRR